MKITRYESKIKFGINFFDFVYNHKEREKWRMRIDLMDTSKDNHEIVKRFEHILFEIHNCSIACDKDCDKQGKVLEPRTPKVFKLLHLFLKEVSLYSGLEEFLHLYLRCLVNTHAEGVAESMGSAARARACARSFSTSSTTSHMGD